MYLIMPLHALLSHYLRHFLLPYYAADDFRFRFDSCWCLRFDDYAARFHADAIYAITLIIAIAFFFWYYATMMPCHYIFAIDDFVVLMRRFLRFLDYFLRRLMLMMRCIADDIAIADYFFAIADDADAAISIHFLIDDIFIAIIIDYLILFTLTLLSLIISFAALLSLSLSILSLDADAISFMADAFLLAWFFAIISCCYFFWCWWFSRFSFLISSRFAIAFLFAFHFAWCFAYLHDYFHIHFR